MDNLLNKAKEAYRKNNLRLAKTFYEKLLMSDPKNTDAIEGLIDCLYNLGNTKDALEKCKEALKLDPNLLTPHIILAYIYHDLGEINKSREEVNIAIGLNPNSADSLCCYGVLLVVDRKFEEAIHYLKNSIQLDPNKYLAHYNLSVCYQQLRDFKNYHIQEKIIFRLKPNFRNLIALIGSYLVVNNGLRVLLAVGPIILYIMNLKFFLILHFIMIFLYLTAGIISWRNKQLSYVRSNFIMAAIFIVVDALLIIGYP